MTELQNNLSFHKEIKCNELFDCSNCIFVPHKLMRVRHSKINKSINNLGSVGVGFRTSSLSLHVSLHRYADDTLLYLPLTSQLHVDVTQLQNCLAHVFLQLNEDKILIMTVSALGLPVLC